MLMTDSCFIHFLQACFTRNCDHQGVDLNKIITKKENDACHRFLFLGMNARCRHIVYPSHGW